MKFSAIFPAVLLGSALAASSGVQDTLTLTKAEDIHIVNKEGIIGAVANPNKGTSQRLVIARFLC